MKRWIGAVLAACLLALSAVPAAAQGSGLRLTAQQAGARREYGVYVTLDPASARAKDYSYELLEGGSVIASREHVADTACFLPIVNIDAASPGRCTVRVTAYPSGERAGFERAASIQKEFGTAKGCSCVTADRFQLGSGTEGDPYLVGTLGQLLHVNQHATQKCYYMQTADIQFGDYTSMVDDYGVVKLHSGSTYDGNGHVIRGGSVKVTRTGDNAEVFSLKNGNLLNTGFEDMTFSGNSSGYGAAPVGGHSGTVKRCYAININAVGRNHAGGLINCWGIGAEDCYTAGIKASSTSDSTYGSGGLIGYLGSPGAVSPTVARTYAFPAKLSAPKISGIGYIRAGSILNSFYLKGTASYGSLPGNDNTNAAPLELSQFADQSRFEAAGWDFENVWTMGEITYNDASGNAVTAAAPVLRVFAKR